MGLRFILNGRVIDEGETLGQEAINTEQTGGLVFKKIEADHSQDPDIKNLIFARNMADAANAKLQAQTNSAQSSSTNLQSTTSDVVSKALGPRSSSQTPER